MKIPWSFPLPLIAFIIMAILSIALHLMVGYPFTTISNPNPFTYYSFSNAVHHVFFLILSIGLAGHGSQ